MVQKVKSSASAGMRRYTSESIAAFAESSGDRLTADVVTRESTVRQHRESAHVTQGDATCERVRALGRAVESRTTSCAGAA